MNLSAVKPSSQTNITSKQSSLDNHENELRRQITDLQEKKKTISNDKDKTSEEKKKEKQAVQDEIQSLSRELRQYQVQKRQEEAARKQELSKEAAGNSSEKNAEKERPTEAVSGDRESGVLITLSATRDQILNMRRVHSGLARRQRTAVTDEEKADLQKKINNVAKNIGRKVTITEENVSQFKASKKKQADAKPENHQPFDWKGQSGIVNASKYAAEPSNLNLIQNRQKLFSTVSIFIR